MTAKRVHFKLNYVFDIPLYRKYNYFLPTVFSDYYFLFNGT